MKKLFSILLLFLSLQIIAQEKYYTKSGSLTFESSVDSFEEVKAVNTKTTAILKSDGTIAALALTKGFRFKIALMEEHFNENYIESSKYPKAKFSGKIEAFSIEELTKENKNHILKGKLTLRGITKEITVTTSIKMVKNHIFISCKFQVKPEDFGIEIPSIVRKKIAKKVDILLSLDLKKK